jgi:hypothetical protein
MSILKDLLDLQPKTLVVDQPSPAAPIAEARGSDDMSEMIEKWSEQNKAYHWEGDRGVRNFQKLIGVLGYRGMDEFLADNSGCMEAMVEWIGSQTSSEWMENMKREIGEDGAEDNADE